MPSHPAPPSGPRPRATLFIIATPIGNLEDITLRALRILAEVDVIAAEDTRHTGRLLHHYGITTPMLSLHAHNERGRIDTLLARLADGQSVALVSDAGTPLISDPGAGLVSAARAAKVRVEALPGASALLVALVASGLADGEFTFLGFPPKKKARAGGMAEACRRGTSHADHLRGTAPDPGIPRRHGRGVWRAPGGACPRVDEDPRGIRAWDVPGTLAFC